MSVRFSKNEKLQRAAAQRTISDPLATATAVYHSKLLLRQVEKEAKNRAAARAAQPARRDEPAPTQHRAEPPPEKLEEQFAKKRFFDALEQMLEAAGEADPASDPQKETGDPETPAAPVEPCDSGSKPPSEPDKVCELCLVPIAVCLHGANRARALATSNAFDFLRSQMMR